MRALLRNEDASARGGPVRGYRSTGTGRVRRGSAATSQDSSHGPGFEPCRGWADLARSLARNGGCARSFASRKHNRRDHLAPMAKILAGAANLLAGTANLLARAVARDLL